MSAWRWGGDPSGQPRGQGWGPSQAPRNLGLLSHTILLSEERPRPLRKALSAASGEGSGLPVRVCIGTGAWVDNHRSSWGTRLYPGATVSCFYPHFPHPLPQADCPAGASRTSAVPWVSGEGDRCEGAGVGRQTWRTSMGESGGGQYRSGQVGDRCGEDREIGERNRDRRGGGCGQMWERAVDINW